MFCEVLVMCGVLLCGLWLFLRESRFPLRGFCPRLFEFLITLTFDTLRRSRIVSTVFDVIEKEKRTRQNQSKPVVHVRSIMYHESSRTEPKLKRECYVEKKKKKQDLTSKTDLKKKSYLQSSLDYPAGIYLHYGSYQFKKKLTRKKIQWSQFWSFQNKRLVTIIIFDQMISREGIERTISAPMKDMIFCCPNILNLDNRDSSVHSQPFQVSDRFHTCLRHYSARKLTHNSHLSWTIAAQVVLHFKLYF